jgi:hypothetical protein
MVLVCYISVMLTRALNTLQLLLLRLTSVVLDLAYAAQQYCTAHAAVTGAFYLITSATMAVAP